MQVNSFHSPQNYTPVPGKLCEYKAEHKEERYLIKGPLSNQMSDECKPSCIMKFMELRQTLKKLGTE